MVRDPVCGRELAPDAPRTARAYQGKEWHFCSAACASEFAANPGRFVAHRSLSTESLARASARRPWTIIGAWAIVLVAGLALAGALLNDALTIDFAFVNNPESEQAETLLEERLRGPDMVDEIVIVQSEALTVEDDAYRQYVSDLFIELVGLGPDVVQAGTTYYESSNPSLVSADGRTTLIPLVMGEDLNRASERVGQIQAVLDRADGEEGFSLLITGDATVMEDFKRVMENDFRTGDLIGILAGLVVLLGVFGAVTKSALPVVLGIASVAIALGAAAVIGLATPLFFVITIMIAMVGLAVGIDYSLFILSRYAEERRRGLAVTEAIATAGATASRAVLFSGSTVIVALLAMFIVPLDAFRSMALGAVLAVVVAVLAALTLLPAILAVLGDRIDSLRVSLLWHRAREAEGGGEHGFWEWMAHTVMGKPVMSIVAAGGLLLLAALPTFAMRTGMAGVDTFPGYTASKAAYPVLAREFEAGITSPVEVVVKGDVNSPRVEEAIGKLQSAIEADARFGSVQRQVTEEGDLALLSVPPAGSAMSEVSYGAVRTLRSDYIPGAFSGTDAEVLVGGDSAWHVDFFNETDRYMPIAFAFVLAVSFILLTLVFRSLVIPAKAILMNLLSVGAAYGLLVLVFQEGYGAGLLGFERVDRVEAWLPLFLFSILFGLSMDYHVFLLSRIRERFDETGDNAEAVAFGLRSTGSVITGAAAIMVAVFIGFALGDLVATQQMGFGLAVAVFLDATVVRVILVPATMRLLGEWNWWLPSWLGWLPHIGIEGRRPTVARPVLGRARAEQAASPWLR